jgi:tetratricopeptide (TPR) repeat protein
MLILAGTHHRLDAAGFRGPRHPVPPTARWEPASEHALTLYRDLGDRLDQANVLNEMANLGWRTGDYASAAQAAEQALAIACELADRDVRANALISQGITRRLTGDVAGSAQALEETLSIYTDLGNRDGQAETLNELGTLHRLNGNLDQARACHQQARDLATEIHSTWNIACALAGLGRCALSAGRTADAKTNLREAWKISHRAGMAEASQLASELDTLGEAEP